MKKIKEFFNKINFPIELIGEAKAFNVILSVICIMLMTHTCNIKNDYKSQVDNRDKTIEILNSKLDKKVDSDGDTVYMKKIIQENLKDLIKRKDIYNLTENQKLLIKELEKVKRKQNLISKNVVEIESRVKNLKNNEPIIVNDSTFRFVDTLENIYNYDISISNVKSTKFSNPILSINDFGFKNKQIITFNYGDKKEDYPVSLNIKNTNPYFSINDVQGYMIPEIKRQDLKPSLLDMYLLNRIGLDVGVGLMVNPTNSTVTVGPYFGLGYRIYKFKK